METKLELTFSSPAVFYGYTEEVDIIDTVLKDSKGRKVVDEKGKFIPLRKKNYRIYPCTFATEEEALGSLKKTYEWWRKLHPMSAFPVFENCVRKVEPVCPRVHPEMHGYKLVMIPLD